MNLIRYYNQNRKKIWGILIIIVSAFIVLQLVNYLYKINDEKNVKIENKVDIANHTKQDTTQLTTNRSVVTGEKKSENQLDTATKVINTFIEYCNSKELEKAYDLLTNECKTQIYDSLEVFEQAYYDTVFKGEKKTCTVENWVNDTYKVKIIDDILSTGKSNDYTKQDYITIKQQDGEYKLNINRYIESKKINKTTEKDNIQIEVVSKNTFMEYEEYTIKVTNHTESTVLLDGRTEAKTLYLEDSKGVNYSSYSHELTEPMLTVNAGQTKEVTIKFYSSFVATKKIQAIIFSDLMLYDGQLSEKIQFRANI